LVKIPVGPLAAVQGVQEQGVLLVDASRGDGDSTDLGRDGLRRIVGPQNDRSKRQSQFTNDFRLSGRLPVPSLPSRPSFIPLRYSLSSRIVARDDPRGSVVDPLRNSRQPLVRNALISR
jgi:hypothetical protein